MFKKIYHMRKQSDQTFYAILVLVAIVAIWRGFWGLMDAYLIPNHPEVSYLLSILIGLAIISATHYKVKKLL